MFLRTSRLLLRPLFPEDWREVYHGINDADVVRMLARAPWPYSPQDAKDNCSAKREPFDLRFVITLPGENGAPIIGQIGADCNVDVPEIGYWIARDYQGNGYVTEALLGLLGLLAALGVREVEAGHYIDNPASGAVLKKAGFIESGELRPTHALGRGGELVLARRYRRALDALAYRQEIRNEEAQDRAA